MNGVCSVADSTQTVDSSRELAGGVAVGPASSPDLVELDAEFFANLLRTFPQFLIARRGLHRWLADSAFDMQANFRVARLDRVNNVLNFVTGGDRRNAHVDHRLAVRRDYVGLNPAVYSTDINGYAALNVIQREQCLDNM